MRAAVLRELGGPDKLVIEDYPRPTTADGEVVVRLGAAALNRRDLYITYGQYPDVVLPSVMGSDGAGHIEELPAGYSGARAVGEAVVIHPSLGWGSDPRVQARDFRTLGVPKDGTFAEYVALPAENLFPMPAHLSHAEAAALPLAGVTAYRALVSRGELRAGETVLVTGTGGGVASVGIQIATALGARVFVTSTRDENLELARSLGAVGGVNTTDPKWAARLKELTPRVDLVVDSVGGALLPQLLRALRAGGRLVTLGASAGPVPELVMPYVFLKQIDIRGTTMGNADDFQGLLDLVLGHGIRPHIGARLPLERAADALRMMESNSATGKIVLEP
ncbi:MAG: NADPH:quinone reductase and related Zn-dependent oxidoreductase [Naasia sp.]|nr:NADPH:quinone reductase and related Zn-dependent oxidoreductase [Naasia sp.]